MNFEPVSRGDVFFIPAGRVHAIGPGILLAEIQQTSDITYRIYDWERTDDEGKSRELHTDLALEAIDYTYYDSYRTEYQQKQNQTSIIADCPYFTTNLLNFDIPVEKDFTLVDSFIIYICLEGSFELKYYDTESIRVSKGETILLPAVIKNISLNPDQPSSILEVYIK